MLWRFRGPFSSKLLLGSVDLEGVSADRLCFDLPLCGELGQRSAPVSFVGPGRERGPRLSCGLDGEAPCVSWSVLRIRGDVFVELMAIFLVQGKSSIYRAGETGSQVRGWRSSGSEN